MAVVRRELFAWIGYVSKYNSFRHCKTDRLIRVNVVIQRNKCCSVGTREKMVMAHGIFPMVQECVWRELHLTSFQS